MRHRLFLALPCPPQLISKIYGLRPKLNFNLKWEPPEKLHLTTNFIGNVTDENLPTLQKNLASCVLNLASFKIHFGFLNPMFRKHEGSYLCLTPDQPCQELEDLQENLKSSIYHLDIPVADRFWPHITIARLPKSDPVTTKSLLDKIDNLNLKVRFTWPVDSVVLYESRNDRTGTHYSRVRTYPLST